MSGRSLALPLAASILASIACGLAAPGPSPSPASTAAPSPSSTPTPSEEPRQLSPSEAVSAGIESG